MARTDLALRDGLFHLLDLDFAEAFDLEQRLACRSVNRLGRRGCQQSNSR